MEEELIEKIQEFQLEDPSLGYRKLHEKLKAEEAFKDVSLKKVQTAMQKMRSTGTTSGPLLYSASDDGTLREWSFQGDALRSFSMKGGVQCVEVTDALIIAGDSSGLLRVWARSSGEAVRDIQVATRYVKTILVSGYHVFTGDYCNLVQQWNLVTGQCEVQFRGHQAGVISLAMAGDYLVAGGGNGDVLLFDRNKGSQEGDLLVVEPAAKIYKANGFVCSLTICEDRLLVPDRDEHKVVSIRLFSAVTYDLTPENIRDVRTYKCGMPVWQAAATDGFVLGLCRDFTVKKFAAGSRQLLMTIKVTPAAKEAKNPYAFKVAGPRFYVGYLNSGEIATYSLQDGKRQLEKGFAGHKGSVNGFCLDRDFPTSPRKDGPYSPRNSPGSPGKDFPSSPRKDFPSSPGKSIR